MSQKNPIDSPIKRFKAFWLWLFAIAVFAVFLLVLALCFCKKKTGGDSAALNRKMIKKEVDEAQRGVKEKTREVFPKLSGKLLRGVERSAKPLPGVVLEPVPEEVSNDSDSSVGRADPVSSLKESEMKEKEEAAEATEKTAPKE